MEKIALDFKIKKFEFLSIKELYALLQLRAEVFIVEQDCVYQDIDYKDQDAIHILGYKDDELVAYTRIFKSGLYFDKASIGRVLVKQKERNHAYGYDLMEASIQCIYDFYEEQPIKISAQTYLKKFYNNLGFYEVGKEYLEDGIPHIGMIKS
ncbi:GNAT family N-acetyltransferase [Dokdonia sp. Hel_I_53]|uniref:GNAT family N-acetyltransferase n=1 Tax=Dokdonia sp. Hel_I_53 TaxID=1566287 RepID=UPI00119BE8F2|nr:GNAT family N-acetyltransferase [Dokdonia sp. Hel_I_53]TVZ52631.1 ElaA protein [Dokdonia sp. Hel_I_53]